MALVAIWLAVLAPTVSRTTPAAFLFPDMGAWCDAAPMQHHDSGAHDQGPGDACGYCTLFTQAPMLGGSFFAGVSVAPPPDVAVVLPAARHAAAVARFHAPPRGPPLATHA